MTCARISCTLELCMTDEFRCKNLWSFSLFSRYYFPWFYCVDSSVASLYSLFYLNREFHWFLQIVLRNDVINMSRAWDKGKKISVPDRNWALNLPSFFIYHTHDDFVLILAVGWTHVIHEPCIWPSSPRVLRSSVVRASDAVNGWS